jgi:hypothetical protein
MNDSMPILDKKSLAGLMSQVNQISENLRKSRELEIRPAIESSIQLNETPNEM